MIYMNVIAVKNLYRHIIGCINLQIKLIKPNIFVHILVGERLVVGVMTNENIPELNNDVIVCRRCHRKLKDEESRKLGFGKTCYKKYLKRKPNYLFEVTTNETSK